MVQLRDPGSIPNCILSVSIFENKNILKLRKKLAEFSFYQCQTLRRSHPSIFYLHLHFLFLCSGGLAWSMSYVKHERKIKFHLTHLQAEVVKSETQCLQSAKI